MKKEWFVEWFNTDEYLAVYKHRNEKDAECHIKFLLSKINLPANSSILDLACGSGRHSILLAKEGYNVTGVDLSDKLLSEAIKNSKAENLEIEFIKSDIRDFFTKKKFNLILNLFTSFGYFETDEENLLIFKKSFEFLSNKGYFVLDYFNKDYLEKNLVLFSKEENDNYTIIQERKIVNQRVIKKITIERNGTTENYYESVKLYDSKFLTKKLKEIGFEIVNLFGDFFEIEFNQFSSPRFVAICQKP
ncbi:class I SAM-dependent methyltransferase [Ignavibacterium sp.]|uniref:class I SAM-dependent methyltransferase n=1 Tax=Ignavibacterium sp. TaxID=2651167 RepID=UPI00307DEDD0